MMESWQTRDHVPVGRRYAHQPDTIVRHHSWRQGRITCTHAEYHESQWLSWIGAWFPPPSVNRPRTNNNNNNNNNRVQTMNYSEPCCDYYTYQVYPNLLLREGPSRTESLVTLLLGVRRFMETFHVCNRRHLLTYLLSSHGPFIQNCWLAI